MTECEEAVVKIQKELADSTDKTNADIEKKFARKLKLKNWRDLCEVS